MTDSEPAGRTARGRFAPGNPGGPGGSRRRAFELRRAAQEAVTPEMAAAIMRKATRQALEGDGKAARFVFEHVIGRPADVPGEAEPVDLALPPMRTAADCAAATERVTQALLRGQINQPMAETLNALIQTRLKTIDLVDVERQMADLEKHAKFFGDTP